MNTKEMKEFVSCMTCDKHRKINKHCNNLTGLLFPFNQGQRTFHFFHTLKVNTKITLLYKNYIIFQVMTKVDH